MVVFSWVEVAGGNSLKMKEKHLRLSQLKQSGVQGPPGVLDGVPGSSQQKQYRLFLLFFHPKVAQ